MNLIRSLLLALAFACSAAGAQTFPDTSRALKIIVPSGVGSTGDLIARVYARAIGEVAGWNAVVENKAGAEGVIGVQAVKSAAPDGYTIMLTSNSTQVLNVQMLPNLPYDPNTDFVPLVGAGQIPLVMYASASKPYRTLAEVVTAARAAPEKLSFGSNTATGRLAVEMLEEMTGIRLLPVLFRTQPEVFTALGGGDIDVAFGTLASGGAFHKAGRTRALAVSGRTRLKQLPEVPTLQEAGVKDYEFTSWLATYAPQGTPPAAVAALRDIVRRAGRTAGVAEAFNNFAMEPMELAGDELLALQRAEIAKWSKVVQAVAQRKK
jgi:tripartite-type tricarboxylate transporter receptor subunit TctC